MRAEAFRYIRNPKRKSWFWKYSRKIQRETQHHQIQDTKPGCSRSKSQEDRHWVAKAIRATHAVLPSPNTIAVPIQWFRPTHWCSHYHGTAGLLQHANWNRHSSELPLYHHDTLDLHKHTVYSLWGSSFQTCTLRVPSPAVSRIV